MGDLLCVSLWMGPPIQRLATKLEDFRASLSLTSSSTRCRSLDASVWDSSSKSPVGFKEILSISRSASLYQHEQSSYMIWKRFIETLHISNTPLVIHTRSNQAAVIACQLFNNSSPMKNIRFYYIPHYFSCVTVSLPYVFILTLN